jgi:uncharacterized protein
MLMHRIGDWTQTFTGVQFWPLDPRPEDVVLLDIAHALAHMCRYNGHSIGHYSVAEHSVLVCKNVQTKKDKLQALMHDASEAYFSDIIRPIKRSLPQAAEIEQNLMDCIAKRFGFDPVLTDEVKRVDNAILADEKSVLFRHDLPWYLSEPPLGIADDIKCLTTKQAKRLFLNTFYEITGRKS